MPVYSSRCDLFGLSSLESLRKMFSVLFVRDLVHSHIQCRELLELVNFYAPRRSLRENFHFVINFRRNQCASISNYFLDFIDLFNLISRPSFKVQAFSQAAVSGVKGRALASHTDVRGFEPQCVVRFSSLTC